MTVRPCDVLVMAKDVYIAIFIVCLIALSNIVFNFIFANNCTHHTIDQRYVILE